MKKFLLLGLAAAASVSMTAQSSSKGDLDWSNFNKSAANTTIGYGHKTPGTYDVAIMIPETLAGSKLTGISFMLPETSGISDIKGWHSTSIKGSLNKPFNANGETVSVTAPHTELGFVRTDFTQPVEIPSWGLYVGYSLTVEKTGTPSTNYPIHVLRGAKNPKDAFMVKYLGSGTSAGSSYNWDDKGQNGIYTSAIIAHLTDVNGNAVSITYQPEPSRITKDSDEKMGFNITNLGYNGVKSFEYELTCNDETKTYTETIPANEEITSEFGGSYTFYVPVPKISETGNYKYTVKINKVNESDPIGTLLSTSNYVKVYDKLPVKHRVIEENTCTKCGFCTQGFYGLEVMNRLYPGLIAISYHNDMQGEDPMTVTNSKPYLVGGNPGGFVDRKYDIFDYNDRAAGMETAYNLANDFYNRAPADIECEVKWADPEMTLLEAKATVNFPVKEESRYRIDFALLHDGMTDPTGRNPKWTQTNYYGGTTIYGSFPEPEWEKFKNDRNVTGLVYNDIFIGSASTNMKGIVGSLPAPSNIKLGENYEATHTFQPEAIVNTAQQKVLQDKKKLRVVALLINSDKNLIANAVVRNVPENFGETGIDSINPETDPFAVPVAYFDLTGRMVENPSNGIYIVKLSDGRTIKQVIK